MRLAAAAVMAVAAPVTVFTTTGHHHGPPIFAHHHNHSRVFGKTHLGALTANPGCTLTVPRHPLTAKGLATPYVLHSAGADCAEDQATGAFVQATILDPHTGALSVYDPEVVTPGMAAPTPPVPKLPHDAVVGIWTGFNGAVLKLTGHRSVNFAQQAYINSGNFFAALNHSIAQGRTTVPSIGTASDGLACPTSRDFSIVDQDQSDNVPVTYPYAGVANGSDEQLLDVVLGALGCQEWLVPSLDPVISGGDVSPSGMLQEAQAALTQASPVALVPGNDEFVTDNGQFVPPNGTGKPDLFLQNLYRLQVDQPFTGNSNDTGAYCANLASSGAARLALDFNTEAAASAPSFAPIGDNLALVLGNRFQGTWALLGCDALTGHASPIQVTTDSNGVAHSETYNGAPLG